MTCYNSKVSELLECLRCRNRTFVGQGRGIVKNREKNSLPQFSIFVIFREQSRVSLGLNGERNAMEHSGIHESPVEIPSPGQSTKRRNIAGSKIILRGRQRGQWIFRLDFGFLLRDRYYGKDSMLLGRCVHFFFIKIKWGNERNVAI